WRIIVNDVSWRGYTDSHQWGNKQAWRLITASGKYHLTTFQSSRKLKMYYYCQKRSVGRPVDEALGQSAQEIRASADVPERQSCPHCIKYVAPSHPWRADSPRLAACESVSTHGRPRSCAAAAGCKPRSGWKTGRSLRPTRARRSRRV